MAVPRLNRLLRFTALLVVVVYIFVHRSFSKEHHQTILDLKAQLAREQHDLRPELTQPSGDGAVKIEYRDAIDVNYQREKGVLVTLTRNEEIQALARTIRSYEDRFNHRFHYPWIFLNDRPFSDELKRQVRTLVSGEVQFVTIPSKYWSYPDWIDQEKARLARNEGRGDMMYGGSSSYRFMCRFFSGFFYKLEELQKYDYSWRVEPGTELLCDLNYDPFKYMKDNDKHYGFAISIYEFPQTVKSLWKKVASFINAYPQYISQNNLLAWISDDDGKTYNMCHFWTNFEIADLNFFRSEAYETFFQLLDSAGGFFYERWGDAPVHSIAVSLFLDRSDVHLFDDIGYYHNPSSSCPIDDDVWIKNKCICDQSHDVTFRDYSCANHFYELTGKKKPDGWEQHRGGGDYFD